MEYFLPRIISLNFFFFFSFTEHYLLLYPNIFYVLHFFAFFACLPWVSHTDTFKFPNQSSEIDKNNYFCFALCSLYVKWIHLRHHSLLYLQYSRSWRHLNSSSEHAHEPKLYKNMHIWRKIKGAQKVVKAQTK